MIHAKKALEGSKKNWNLIVKDNEEDFDETVREILDICERQIKERVERGLKAVNFIFYESNTYYLSDVKEAWEEEYPYQTFYFYNLDQYAWLEYKPKDEKKQIILSIIDKVRDELDLYGFTITCYYEFSNPHFLTKKNCPGTRLSISWAYAGENE